MQRQLKLFSHARDRVFVRYIGRLEAVWHQDTSLHLACIGGILHELAAHTLVLRINQGLHQVACNDITILAALVACQSVPVAHVHTEYTEVLVPCSGCLSCHLGNGGNNVSFMLSCAHLASDREGNLSSSVECGK